MKEVNEIKREMSHFFGTENYYAISPFLKKFYMTDGVKYIADACESYWLMENIAFAISDSIKKNGLQRFIAIDCHTSNGAMKISFTDGNKNKLKLSRRFTNIDFTDFPLDKITIWAEFDGTNYIVLLPTEH